MFDAVVIGAGISGAVVAERLAASGRRVLVVEQRPHLAGNCHDRRDEDGLLIQTYGPHIFHTDRRDVWNYLSGFTEWHSYQHRGMASIDGALVPIPFNLDSLHRLYPASLASSLEQRLLDRYGFGEQVPILRLRESDDAELRALADYIHSRVFANYSRKQWGIDPEDLDPLVTGRVPVRISRDDRYFLDPWQAMPRQGYTRMVERMLAHPNIRLMLQTAMEDVLSLDWQNGRKTLFGMPYDGLVVYTGMVDALLDYRYGRLPYRTLRFELERVDGTERQPVALVNHPNEHDYTRITDFGHFMGRPTGPGTLMREYPMAYEGPEGGGMPYYPVFTAANHALFERYRSEVGRMPGFHLLGRLAQYKYYDMDDAVAAALNLFQQHLSHP